MMRALYSWPTESQNEDFPSHEKVGAKDMQEVVIALLQNIVSLQEKQEERSETGQRPAGPGCSI